MLQLNFRAPASLDAQAVHQPIRLPLEPKPNPSWPLQKCKPFCLPIYKPPMLRSLTSGKMLICLPTICNIQGSV